MLRHVGIPHAEERGEFADRTLAVDQLTEDQQPVAIGQGLEQLARGVGGDLHFFDIYFHTCVYTNYRIYCQPPGSTRLPLIHSNGALIAVKQGQNQTEEVSWRNSSFSVQVSAEH